MSPKQLRSSSRKTNNNLGFTLSPSSSSSSSTMSAAPKKKLRFRRSSTGSSSASGRAHTKGRLSWTLDDSSSTNSASSASGGKKRSLLSRLIMPRSSSHSNLELVLENAQRQYGGTVVASAEARNDHENQRQLDEDKKGIVDEATLQALDDAADLEQRGRQEQDNKKCEVALSTWKEALALLLDSKSSSVAAFSLSNQIVCRVISLHLHLHTTAAASKYSHHLEVASTLMSEQHLESLNEADAARCVSYLEGPTNLLLLLLDLLMRHSCWALALHVAYKLALSTDTNAVDKHDVIEPLVLARLHLEVAVQELQVSIDLNDKEERAATAASPQQQRQERVRRQQQLSHLAECHQLLLSYDSDKKNTNDEDESDTYQCLWQDLAQAYGMMGEEELALGCCQSRIQHLGVTSPKEVAMAHFQQAMNVYTPVVQYGLALKEAELALESLQQLPMTTSIATSFGGSNKEHKEEEAEEVELLLMKLHEFKADVLCRMGRIVESIQSYETLLHFYLHSAHHGPVEAANVLYILGKLSVRAKRFLKALDYFDQEMQMTKSVVGPNHLAISKILHELAKVADLGLMDYPRAAQYYQEALQVESRVYQQCKKQQQQNDTPQKAHKQQSSVDLVLLQDTKSQIGETKQCLGKLHFKMGDFDRAVKISTEQ